MRQLCHLPGLSSAQPPTRARFPFSFHSPAPFLPNSALPLRHHRVSSLRAQRPAVTAPALPHHLGDTPPGPPWRRRDVTRAPWPSGRGRGRGAGGPAGGGAGARVQLRASAAIAACAVPSPRPLPPSRAEWSWVASAASLRGAPRLQGLGSSAAQWQAPRQLCETEAGAVALGGGRAGPGPLMVPPRRHRWAGRPGRQAGGGPRNQPEPKLAPSAQEQTHLRPWWQPKCLDRNGNGPPGAVSGRPTRAGESGAHSGSRGSCSRAAAAGLELAPPGGVAGLTLLFLRKREADSLQQLFPLRSRELLFRSKMSRSNDRGGWRILSLYHASDWKRAAKTHNTYFLSTEPHPRSGAEKSARNRRVSRH